MSQFRARPALVAYSITALFSTGSLPGIPVQTGQHWVLGSPPKAGGAGAEDFCFGGQFYMGFQADNGFPGHITSPPFPSIVL